MSEFEHTGSEQQGFTGDAGAQGGGPDAAAGSPGGEEFTALGVEDPLAAEPTTKKKHSGPLVIILVVGLAGGSLFAMHTLTKVTAASGRNTDIEKTIEDFLKSVGGESPDDPGGGAGELVEGHREVVGVLTDDYTERQVSGLQRDPFDILSGPVGVDMSGDTSFAQAQRRDHYERAAEKLQLKSVIMGRNPLANINGRIVRRNQEIPVVLSRTAGTVTFRVVSITSSEVKVVAEDPKLELRVEKVLRLKR